VHTGLWAADTNNLRRLDSMKRKVNLIWSSY